MRVKILIFCFVVIVQSVVAQDFYFPQQDYFYIPKNKKHQPYTRLAFSAGYAYRIGDIGSVEPEAEKLAEKFRQGFHLDGELQYLFHKNWGIGLIVNHVRQSASAEDIYIPLVRQKLDYYKEAHALTFLGPEVLLYEETKRWLWMFSVGTGPIFFHVKMKINDTESIGTSVNWGINYGAGLQYKFSYDFAAGIKLSMTGGVTESLRFKEQTIDFDNPISLGNFMFSVYCSFRLDPGGSSVRHSVRR